MKFLLLSAALLMASLSQAATVRFNSYSELPEEVQQEITKTILRECPMAQTNNWAIYEYWTEDSRAGDGIVFRTDLTVYGTGPAGDPQNGTMTVDTYMIVRDQIEAKVLGIQGLCH